MNRISISQAWSHATGFFSGQGINHAAALIGVGIVVPLVLQFLIGGGAAMTDPMAFAGGRGMAAMGPLAMLVGFVNYVLQTGSYFASWRIGFSDGDEPLGGAIAYGMIAALPVLLLVIAAGIILVLVAFLVFGGAFLPMLMGGQPSQAATATTGILMLLLIPLFLLFLVWLGARLCCMGPVMADRRSFNVLTGLNESWQMTAASQWKIFGYFLLIGLAMIVLFVVLGAVVGLSMFAGGGAPSTGSMIGIIVGAMLLGIPMAYFQVAVPAGIYRALGGQGSKGDIFA